MKEFHKRILGDEVFLAEEYRIGKFTPMNVATDRSNIFVEKFGNLTSSVEIKVGGHLIPSFCFICFSISNKFKSEGKG